MLSASCRWIIAPGEKWDYNNSGLSLLGPVVHKATGQNIDQILDEQVFKKIGIPREDWTWEDRDGMPIPYSGLHITARSLARFGLLFLNKGTWQRQQDDLRRLGRAGDARLARSEQAVWLSVVEQQHGRLARRAG